MSFTADFELGTATNPVAATDTGSLTAWSSVSINGGCIISYSSTQAAHGTKSVYMQGNGATGAGLMAWSGFGSLTDWYGRFYAFPLANPSSATDRPANIFDHLGAHSAAIALNNDRTISVIDASFIPVATVATALPINQWSRVEWHFVHSGSSGSGLVSVYTSPDSASATDSASFSGATIGADADSSRISHDDLPTGQGIFYDQICHAASSAVGPFPVNLAAPSVTGTATVGATLSVTTGTWNGTFTFTYQWTRDGVNIGGATGNSYVSQSADSGHVVSCKTRATGVQATNENATQAASNGITVAAAVALVPGPAPLLGRFG